MPSRSVLTDELESLRLQVEVMSLLVAEAVEGTQRVLKTGDRELAAQLIASDDAIDEMHISLVEHCYELLALKSPMASDLRLVVSVVRVLHELERIGDLCLRAANAVDDIPLVAGHSEVYQVLLDLAADVVGRFRSVQRAWSEPSVDPLDTLDRAEPLTTYNDRLIGQLMGLRGEDSVRVALATVSIGRSLDRIGDHSQIMASRLRYLLTGDPVHLADEVA